MSGQALLAEALSRFGAGSAQGTLDVVVRVTDEDLAAHDRHSYSDSQGKLSWLRRRYVPTVLPDGLLFPTGCLETYSSSGLGFRGRCEWFRKLLADVRHVQDLTGVTAFTVSAVFWTRPVETPLIRLWAQRTGLIVPEDLDRLASRILATWPLERAVIARNAIYRRSLLRYYLLVGDITTTQFHTHRNKTTAQMDVDSRLLTL